MTSSGSPGLSGRREASSFNRVMAFCASSNAKAWCSAVAVDSPALTGSGYQRGIENAKFCFGFQNSADGCIELFRAKPYHL